MNTRVHDVMIVGAGIGGGVLAAALARRGRSVLVVDSGQHPRFAIGESTTPYSTQSLNRIAEQFDLPELAPKQLFRKRLLTSCGIKRNFGFVYQKPGEEPNPATAQQSRAPGESHLFRQDSDAHVLHYAISLGAHVRENTRIAAVDLEESVVRARTDKGEELLARFLVDASGPGSPLSRMLGLTTSNADFCTSTGSLFTHMIDVKPFDDVWHHTMPGKFHQGTLHHVFDPGWIWVIPFNNHARSTNPLISVGLQLDCRKETLPTAKDAEAYFRERVSRYPAVARQFEHAKSARPWVVAPRMQFRQSAACGWRFCSLPSAYGFVDALYSRGLSHTFDGIWSIAQSLETTPRSEWGDLGKRLGFDEEYRNRLDINDRLVAASYLSFRDAKLWRQLWFVWLSTTAANEMSLIADRIAWRRGCNHTTQGTGARAITDADEHVRKAFAIVDRMEKGELSVDEATGGVQALNENISFMPPFARRYTEIGRDRLPMLRELPETLRWLSGTSGQIRDVYRHVLTPDLLPALF